MLQPLHRISWLLAAGAFSVSACATTPDWVRAAAAQTVTGTDKDTPAVVLLDEQSTTVSETGETSTLYRRVVKILRTQGRDYAEMPVFYDKETKLKSIHAWSITAKGQEYELKDKDFLETQRTVEMLYDDERVKIARIPGLDPGTVVAIEFEQRRRPYLLADEWSFQEKIPVLTARYRLALPSSWEYSDFWVRHERVKSTEQGTNVWFWELKDIPAVEKEPSMPYWGAIAGRMMLSFFGNIRGSRAANAVPNWKDLASWYVGLAQSRVVPSPEITAMAERLTANSPDFLSKVSAITKFMQSEVRYVAIEIGIGGYQPHAAADTFRNRYGDCKDKATLLISMLHEVGIPAAWVLVHSERGVVVPEAPSPDEFNHVITAIELPASLNADNLPSVVTTKSGKKYLLFDPTDPYTPVGQLHADLQGSYGLLSTAGNGELIELPVFAPSFSELKRVAHLKLQTDGSLVGDVEETRTGEHAWYSRHSLLSSQDVQRSKALDNFLGGFLTGFTLNSSAIDNLEQNDHSVILKYNFTARNYAKTAGPLLLVRPRVLGEKGESVAMDKPRKLPLQFSSATHQQDIFEIELPQGFTVDELPDPVKVDVGFAEYESKTEVSGQLLRYTRNYTVKELQVPIERERQWKHLFATIYSDERNSAVLKKQ
jgi:hypothetical protein